MGKEIRWWFLPAAAALMVLAVTAVWLLKEEESPEPPPRMIAILDAHGQQRLIELEEFLIGVVAAEMPASFDEQALQAQAVAARTYIAARLAPFGKGKHGNAAVCCDSACCQAYMDANQLKAAWGSSYDHNLRRVTAAVQATAGEILLWRQRPAEALFHSACGGITEEAAALWGRSLPYLEPVNCGYCGHAPRYAAHFTFTLTEAARLLELDEDELRGLRVLAYTPGGRVAQARAGDRVYGGAELRKLLNLNSAAFTWLIMGESIVFSTVGFGHGVGLCQYGADGMAEAGNSYEQILSHYYPGTAINLLDAPE